MPSEILYSCLEKKPASSSPDPDSLSEDKPQKKADHSETAKVGPQTKTSAKGKKASTKSSASPVVKAFSVTISPSIHSKPDQPSKVKPAEISKASDSSSDDKPAKKQVTTVANSCVTLKGVQKTPKRNVHKKFLKCLYNYFLIWCFSS